MAKINIAELNIDVSSLIKSTTEVKQAIDNIKSQQKELTKAGETSSNQFIQNSADLKVLTSAYNANIKALAENTQATSDQANREQMLALALNTEVSSIKEAREQNNLLNKLRNESNALTAEGQADIIALNAKLDENNKFIKENSDAYAQQKINIGNYSESIKDALANINPLNGGLTGFIQRSQQAGGVGNLFKESLGGATAGMWGLVKSSLAFIATPLGAVIAIIATVLTTLYSVFKSFTPVVDKVEQAMSALSAVFSVIKNTIISLVTGAKNLGEAFSSLGGDMAKAAQEAANLKKAQQDLEDAMKEQEVQSAKNRAEINRLNIQAKDRTKTEEERIALLSKASKLEQDDYNQRKKNSDEALRIAYEEIRISAELTDKEFAELKKRGIAYKEYTEKKATGQDELYDKLQQALIKETEIQNEFYANQEKNINKQNKLIEDAEAKAEKAREEAKKRAEEAEKQRQKRIDDLIAQQEQELEYFKEKQRFAKDDLDKQKTFADKEIEILKTKLKNKRITQAEYDTEALKIQNDLKEYQSQLEEEEIKRITDFASRKKQLQDEIDLQYITSEEEKYTLKLARDYEKHLSELETLNINETEKGELQKLITEQYQNQLTEYTNKQAQKRLQDQVDAKNKEIDFEKQKNTILIDLAKQLGNTLIALLGDSIGAKIAGIALEAIMEIAKIRISTAAAKQINLANATASAPFPLNLPLIAAATAQNVALTASSTLQQQQIIASSAIKTFGAVAKFAGGGFVEAKGASHTEGGIPIHIGGEYFGEMQGGEGLAIMNRGAFNHFKAFNSTFGDSDVKTTYNGSYYAGGGVITQGVQKQTIDINQLALVTAEAIKNIPPIYVTVTDIQQGVNNYARVVDGANF